MYDREAGLLTVRRVLYRGKRPYEVVTDYAVTHLNSHPSIGAPAVRLTQEDGTSYDVIRRPWGWECECWDWLSRRKNSKEPCKHITAVTKGEVLADPADRGDSWEGE